ncbi:hypothetical protein SUGI_0066690 [Cryptomeria japonica]|uniref:uncharacterized protein LOC131070329 n=1 Tax=Cryptomeria japonica TaxID=3369 RepID=UPI002408BDC0|nr:uncharacterized protein LOC131070329 [Cryptomeria japonica]GLJ07422.1 hypothetical protein SUGI_0066690 [Cryptomeria japonica]
MSMIRRSLSLGKALRRLKCLPVSSSVYSNYYCRCDAHTALPLSQTQPLPRHELRLLPYNLRAFSDSTTVPPEIVESESTRTEQENKEDKEDNKTHPDIKDEQTKVLEAALGYVPKLGWTEAAMVAGAKDVGISPSIVGAFPRKEAALVEYFMDDCLQRLMDEIESHNEELSNMVLKDRIAKLIRIRLEMQAPYVSKWPQALSIQAKPLNLPTSFKQRAILVDEIWHAAGDRSTDVDWYAKRTVLGGVYTATELYMLTDYSPEFRGTWSFLDNRIRDALDCRKTAQEATQLATAIGAGISNTFQAFLRRQP